MMVRHQVDIRSKPLAQLQHALRLGGGAPTTGAARYLTEAGREGTFVWRTGNYAALVTADPLQGLYVASTVSGFGTTVGCWVRTFTGLADVRWWGAKLDDTTNDTDAFNAALALARNVFFPPGRAYITNMVTIPQWGSLVGVAVEKSVFSIKANFNMAAEGVVKMGDSARGAFADKIGWEFYQPTVATRAQMIQYPPAINQVGIPRNTLGHIRITRAWDGIKADGNVGGLKYDYVEVSALRRSLLIDGALDTCDIGFFKHWTYVIGVAGDGGTGDVFRDQTVVAAEIGRSDGLEGTIISFHGGVLFNANATAGGGTPRHLKAVHLDSDGAWLESRSGQIDIDYLYFTSTSAATRNRILLQGAGNPVVRIKGIHGSTTDTFGAIYVLAGTLDIEGGRVLSTNSATRVALIAGGTLKLRDVELECPGARTQPIIRADAGTLLVQNNDVLDDSGTGEFLLATTSAVQGRVGGNKPAGRKLNISPAALLDGINQGSKGYVPADAVTSLRLPAGWSVSKPATGNYAITHNLGWTQSRQAITVSPQNGAIDASAIIDQVNTTINVLRIRTFSAGVAADMAFSFTIDMV